MRECELDYTVLQCTRKWFSKRNLPTFREQVMPRYRDKPCVYFEIGVYEGLSARWMCDYVLTHPLSRMVAVDTWLMSPKRSNAEMEEVYQRAKYNLAPYLNATTEDGHHKCQLIRAMSADAMAIICRKGGWGLAKRNSVDVLMVDGHHSEFAVVDDARHAIQLLKPGGLLIFDDVRNDKEKEAHHVYDGIQLFLKEAGHRVQLAFQGRYLDAYEKIQ